MQPTLENLQAQQLSARGVHMMGPGPADVHVDQALSNLAVQYRPNAGVLIADQVSPVVTVSVRSGLFFVYGAGNAMELQRADIASQMGMPSQVNWGIGQDSFAVKDYGFRDFVPADVESVADSPIRPVADSTEVCMDRLGLAREYRVANMIATTGNYGSNVQALSGSSCWDVDGSDPVGDIDAAMATKEILVGINTCVMGRRVWDALRRHPAIERYILSRAGTRMGGTPLTVTPDMFGAAFGIDKVLIGNAKYASQAPGATLAVDYVWGNVFALLGVTKNPAIQRVETFGYSIRFVPSGSTQYEVRTWFDQAPGVRGGTWVKVTHSEVDKVVGGNHAGFLFTGCLSS